MSVNARYFILFHVDFIFNLNTMKTLAQSSWILLSSRRAESRKIHCTLQYQKQVVRNKNLMKISHCWSFEYHRVYNTENLELTRTRSLEVMVNKLFIILITFHYKLLEDLRTCLFSLLWQYHDHSFHLFLLL